MKIRNGEKPYQCVQCDKAFSKQVSLSIHLRIHTEEKPHTYQILNYIWRYVMERNHISVLNATQWNTLGKNNIFTYKDSTGGMSYYCNLCKKILSHKKKLFHVFYWICNIEISYFISIRFTKYVINIIIKGD